MRESRKSRGVLGSHSTALEGVGEAGGLRRCSSDIEEVFELDDSK